jgi:pyruvate formate lyase activating enzyme
MNRSPAKALLFDIQRFCIHDGPGIRTTLFFKGCPLRCLWCQNPESQKTGPEMAFYQERCLRCFACKAVCPEDAIREDEARRIETGRCTACGKCASGCDQEALRLVGVAWDAVSLLTEVLNDRDFFEESGGGITLSGGEPAMQAGFLASFLPRVREAGVTVNLETCGWGSWEHWESLLPYLDLIYFDLKLMDAERHRRYTGSPNGPILDNFQKLARAFPRLEARMPVIPSINDDVQNIRDTARFLRENSQDRIHLLRYHSLGEAKLIRIETRLQPLHLEGDALEARQRAKQVFEQEGIFVQPDD